MSIGKEYFVQETDLSRQQTALETMDDKYLYALDEITVTPKSTRYLFFKSVLERLVAAILLIILSPVILFFATLVRLTSKGPGFYFQRRLGLNGSTYVMVKLRTMVHDAESGTGAIWASSSDPRVTPLGLFLRKTQVDEFPQLWNVLTGKMSLIGPRPERPEIAQRLELDIPHYPQRLKVKPGITGLAQLTLPADTDLESVRRKLIPDLYYVQNVSFLLDLKIFLHTGIYFTYSLWKFARASFALPNLEHASVSIVEDFENNFDQFESKAS